MADRLGRRRVGRSGRPNLRWVDDVAIIDDVVYVVFYVLMPVQVLFAAI